MSFLFYRDGKHCVRFLTSCNRKFLQLRKRVLVRLLLYFEQPLSMQELRKRFTLLRD